jgi:hypothetical protein
MDKRILKRHKRQVSRAREQIKLSQPDLRTPEQVAAAREVSRSVASRHSLPYANYANSAGRNSAGRSAESAPKADAE